MQGVILNCETEGIRARVERSESAGVRKCVEEQVMYLECMLEVHVLIVECNNTNASHFLAWACGGGSSCVLCVNGQVI